MRVTDAFLALPGPILALAVVEDLHGHDFTGLSIVRALVRDELGGELMLVDDNGLRAEVRFPARTGPGKDDDANPHR